jgi:8-oxo-dGTP pyrophosphatase MutT (NUDIX family)
VAIPGGHIDPGERPGQALIREAREELGILHYYAVRSWEGDIVPEEAEGVLWLPLDAVQRLDFDVDRTAVNEYQRLTREGGLVWRTNR